MRCKIASLFTVIVLLTPCPTLAADNTPPCLSREQAKAKYPGAHLYWHTINRCWDNIPVGRSKTVIRAAPPIRPLPVERPQVPEPPPPGEPSSVFYPDLMPGNPPSASLLVPEPVTQWPLTDFDEMPPPFAEWNARVNGQFR